MPRAAGPGLDCDPTMMIRFRPLLALATSLALAASPSFAQEPQPKTLRYAFRIAETGFDPASITDLYSRTVAGAIFDAPLEFEFLARPARVRPNTAAAMPYHRNIFVRDFWKYIDIDRDELQRRRSP